MLGRMALRISAIEALKGKTLVGNNVLDSQIGALDVAADNSIRTDQQKPFISVYTEASKLEGTGTDLGGIRSLFRSGLLDFVVEVGISAAMTEVDTETGAATVVGIGIPATDAGMEFFLDATGRQVVAALHDPANRWSEVWRRLINRVAKIERRRAADATSNVRIAAHQLVISVEPCADPTPGEPIGEKSAWQAFLQQIGSADHPLREKIADLFGAETDSHYNQQRGRFGLTVEEARALFDFPPLAAEQDEPDIASVAVSGETGDGDD